MLRESHWLTRDIERHHGTPHPSGWPGHGAEAEDGSLR
jgi:hypothetical protein